MKKHRFLLVIAALLTCVWMTSAQNRTGSATRSGVHPGQQSNYSCLPGDVTLETVISTTRKTPGLVGPVTSETALQRLRKLGARCAAGKLLDAKRREIRFYHLQGCWGNPPQDYREILLRQD